MNFNNMQKHPALVGIVPRKNIWDIIQKQRWYHIPVESAPKNAVFVEYLAFYFPKIFDEIMQYKVIYYAKVKKADIVKRIQLFPEEKEHQRANKNYFQFHLGKLKNYQNLFPV